MTRWPNSGMCTLVNSWAPSRVTSVASSLWPSQSGRKVQFSCTLFVVVCAVLGALFSSHTNANVLVLFSPTAVFCTGGRDGQIMVWDTRCSKKGTYDVRRLVDGSKQSTVQYRAVIGGKSGLPTIGNIMPRSVDLHRTTNNKTLNIWSVCLYQTWSFGLLCDSLFNIIFPLQTVSTGRWNRSVVHTINPSDTHLRSWRRDGRACGAWLMAWWVSLTCIMLYMYYGLHVLVLRPTCITVCICYGLHVFRFTFTVCICYVLHMLRQHRLRSACVAVYMCYGLHTLRSAYW